MNRFKYPLVWLLFLSISITGCYYIRLQMIPSDFDETMDAVQEVIVAAPQFPYEKRGYYTDFIYEEEFNSFNDLWDASDIIIQASLSSRRQDSVVVKSTINIEKLLKTNEELKENQITVFEDYFIDADKRLNIPSGCSLPMQYGNSYILFLKKDTNYQKQAMYRLTSLYYGKYPVDDIKIYRAELDVYTENSNSIYGNEMLSYNMAVFDLQKDIDFFGDEEEFASMKKANIRYMQDYEKTYIQYYDSIKKLLQDHK